MCRNQRTAPLQSLLDLHYKLFWAKIAAAKTRSIISKLEEKKAFRPSDGRVVAHRAGEEFRDASITAKRSDPDNLSLKVNVCFIIMLAVVALFC